VYERSSGRDVRQSFSLKRFNRYVEARKNYNLITTKLCNTRVCTKVSRLVSSSENCKWYSSLSLGAVVPLFYESV
jgi:hypothetical protein